MKMTVFWDAASYSLAKFDREGDRPDDGSSKHL
jgi:hypothetical protein